MNKMNTFKDFIACAEKLIADGGRPLTASSYTAGAREAS